jgi:2-oxoglutarate dehydrogenase E1 component
MPPIDAANLHLLEETYDRFCADPSSVDESWRHFFEGMEFGMQRGGQTVESSDLRIYNLIFAYRTYGHLLAKFNPIDPHPVESVPELSLERLGFSQADLGERFPTCGLLEGEEATLQEIIDALQETYCGSIGFEYMGLNGLEVEQWIQEQIEPRRAKPNLTIDQKRQILQLLNESELLEIFLHTKYVGQKRFSLEGGETAIPVLGAMIDEGAENGVEELAIAMAHRGRLNVLANIMRKPYQAIFHEFEDVLDVDSFEGSGDVKYHKGHSADVETSSGKQVHLSMAANPSHLESVDCVLQGQTRAKQVLKGDDKTMERIVPILIHGDASVAGQGVVYETMQLGKLPGYGVGGALHLVINNQIGFTTLPRDSRSTRYCTSIARAFVAPVFHVNGDDPEACAFVASLAMRLRQKFHCDVFIDMNCYRKYGHNESDEPAFTQPLEYSIIRNRESVRVLYRDDLIQQGVLERQMAEALEGEFRDALQKELDQVQTLRTKPEPPTRSREWEIIAQANKEQNFFDGVDTTVDLETLGRLGARLCDVPEGFNLHRKVQRLLQDRLKAVEEDPATCCLNWGMAELLAYATLVDQGLHVRLSGQDSRRGTFNHRHAMWVDQKEEARYFPLNHIGEKQGRFDVFNSSLAELAVLGFEYGYSLSYPDALVLWEAQFGDFSNGAQVIIDEYISTGEQKWGRYSGLALLLPHAYEGQGPDHSSGRIERCLQLAGDNNMIIANATTPGQLFHLLRRQVLWQMRKPLILFTPKSLLGHPKCLSCMRDLAQGGFEEILDDETPPERAEQLVLVSGRLYYDLIAEREARGDKRTAIVRLEQLYPLHEERLKELFAKYGGDLIWAQDEPSNMGGWDYVRPLLRDLHGEEPRYVGRPRSASPATGSARKHKAQQAEILDEVFGS